MSLTLLFTFALTKLESYAMIKIKYYKVITEFQSPIHRTNSDGQAFSVCVGVGVKEIKSYVCVKAHTSF